MMVKNNYKFYHYIIGAFFTMAIAGAIMPETIYASVDVGNRLGGVSINNFMGTDLLGRDIFLRIVRGAYNVSIIALPSVLFGIVIGGFLGLVSAYKKTNLTYAISAVMDIIFAFPIILLALVLVAKYGSHPMVGTATLGVFFIPVFYRMVYMTTLPMWQADYIVSARLSGLSNFKIAFKHILPNLKPVLITQSSVQFAMAILAEAGLGYLGLSVMSPDPTWGSMLMDAQRVVFINPIFGLPIGLAIFLTVWSFISAGEGK